jgi:MOSC domain-containing protein YiiM
MRADEGVVAAVSRNGTYAFTKPVCDEIVLVAGVGVAGDVHAGVYVKHRGRVRADPTQPNLRQVHLMQQELFAEVGAKGYAVAAGNLGENVTTSGIDLLALPRGTILRFGPPAGAGGTQPELARPAGTGGGTGGGTAVAERGAGSAAEESRPRPGAGVERGGAGPDGLGRGGEAGSDGAGPLGQVLGVAAAAVLDGPTAASAAAVAAAVGRDRGDDPRAAVIVAGLRNPCGQINGFRDGLLKEVVGRDEDGNLVRKAGVMAVVLRGGAIRPGYVVTAELPPPPHAPLDRV